MVCMKKKPQISNEKRELIVAAKKRGESDKTIMEWLGLRDRGVITRVWSLAMAGKPYLLKRRKGNNIKITNEISEAVRAKIKDKPDITLVTIIEELELNITEACLSKHLKKIGLTYKKRRLNLKHKNE